MTQYASTVITACIGLLWIPAYFNRGDTLNPWYTIFIDLDQVCERVRVRACECQHVCVMRGRGSFHSVEERVIVLRAQLDYSFLQPKFMKTELFAGCRNPVQSYVKLRHFYVSKLYWHLFTGCLCVHILQAFTQGITQVLFSMCVIELAKKGQGECICVHLYGCVCTYVLDRGRDRGIRTERG